MRHRRTPPTLKLQVELLEAETHVVSLEPGDALVVVVDPSDFDVDARTALAEAFGEMLAASGKDPRRCLVIAANELGLTIARQVDTQAEAPPA